LRVESREKRCITTGRTAWGVSRRLSVNRTSRLCESQHECPRVSVCVCVRVREKERERDREREKERWGKREKETEKEKEGGGERERERSRDFTKNVPRQRHAPSSRPPINFSRG